MRKMQWGNCFPEKNLLGGCPGTRIAHGYHAVGRGIVDGALLLIAVNEKCP